MLYIKMSKINNVDQQGVWLGCKRRGVTKWGCGPRGCGKRGCGLGEKGGGKKILNGMLYIKMVKLKNVVQ